MTTAAGAPLPGRTPAATSRHEVVAAEGGAAGPPAGGGAPVGLELRFLRGKRRGEALPLTVGALRIGTARTNELQVREAGVSFRHAVVHVDEAGGVEVEDLGARGGTFVNDAALRGRAPLRVGDRVRLGDEVELQLAEASARDPREALAVLVPQALVHELPEVDDLRLGAAMSTAHADALAEAADDEAREALRADAASFAADLRGLLRAGLVPDDVEGWLRWAGPDPVACLAAPGEVYVLARRWELLAWLPDLPRGEGATRVVVALAWLLQGAARLAPRQVDDLGQGAFACVFEAERPMLGRFSRLHAVGDGRALAIAATPAVVPATPSPRSAEDPIEDALRAARETNRWRPPARGLGPAAPPMPPGGRYARTRPRPERAK